MSNPGAEVILLNSSSSMRKKNMVKYIADFEMFDQNDATDFLTAIQSLLDTIIMDPCCAASENNRSTHEMFKNFSSITNTPAAEIVKPQEFEKTWEKSNMQLQIHPVKVNKSTRLRLIECINE